MELQQKNDPTFPKTLTDKEIDDWADEFISSELLMKLIKNPKSCFYIFFTRSGNAVKFGAEFNALDREDVEKIGFLKFRGGSRPVLSKPDGSAISSTELFGKKGGFQTAVIHEERNWCNLARLEKSLHKKLMGLKVGHRLWRKAGGAQMAEDCESFCYGVHVAYNLEGYGDYVLHDKVEDDDEAFTANDNAAKEKVKKSREERRKKKEDEEDESDDDSEEDEE